MLVAGQPRAPSCLVEPTRSVFLEAGSSWVPFMMDRVGYEYESIQGGEIRKKVKHKPSWYMTETDNFWVSCEMGERALKYTIDMRSGSGGRAGLPGTGRNRADVAVWPKGLLEV